MEIDCHRFNMEHTQLRTASIKKAIQNYASLIQNSNFATYWDHAVKSRPKYWIKYLFHL